MNTYTPHTFRPTFRLIYCMAVAMACAVTFSGCKKNSPNIGADNEFRVEHPERLTKIFLAGRNGSTVTLTQATGGKWRVNNEFDARPDMVAILLETLQNLSIRFAAEGAMQKNSLRALATQSVKVELYEGSLLKTFYIGGEVERDEMGTLIMAEGAKMPYVAHISGFDGTLVPRFSTDLYDWRDRTLFAFPKGTIEELSVEYPAQRDNSFHIIRKNGDYTIEPLYQSTTPITKEPIKGIVAGYLVGYERIIAENFEIGNTHKDSIIHATPFCTFTVKATGLKEPHVVQLYPVPGRPVEEPVRGMVERASVERYFVYLNHRDFMVGQHALLNRVLWGYPYFFEKPK